MTATDELLTLLKEHGVEHYEHEAPATDCIAFFDGRGWHDCWESVDGEVNVTFSMTPEQAIAATLRQAVRHPKPHEKWTTVLLPEIAWSWDDSWPDYLSVAHDTHGEWRTYVPESTLGAGTCHEVMIDRHWRGCSECGYVWENMYGEGFQKGPNYCPMCGRKVVSE